MLRRPGATTRDHAGTADASPTPPPPPPPASGCPTTGVPSQDYARPTDLAGTYCATFATGAEQDWFGWSVAAAGVAYDVKLVVAGDATVAMWKLVNGQYSRVANTSVTEIAKTSSSAGSYVVRVTSPSAAVQSYAVTLTR